MALGVSSVWYLPAGRSTCRRVDLDLARWLVVAQPQAGGRPEEGAGQ
jgi:hypothetical protein